MPLPRSAARRASRKNEVLPLLGWNGGTEDAASGDDWSSRSVTCIDQQAPSVLSGCSVEEVVWFGELVVAVAAFIG